MIKRKDIMIYPGMIVFTVRSSKTKHLGDEPLRIPIMEISNKKFCVYTRLIRHLSQTQGTTDCPLIMKSSPYGCSPLMYSEVLQFLKTVAMNIQVDPSRVGLHSLRRTGAMHLYSIGIPINDIRLMGGWKSMAVLVYLSAPFKRLVQVENLLAAAFNKL